MKKLLLIFMVLLGLVLMSCSNSSGGGNNSSGNEINDGANTAFYEYIDSSLEKMVLTDSSLSLFARIYTDNNNIDFGVDASFCYYVGGTWESENDIKRYEFELYDSNDDLYWGSKGDFDLNERHISCYDLKLNDSYKARIRYYTKSGKYSEWSDYCDLGYVSYETIYEVRITDTDFTSARLRWDDNTFLCYEVECYNSSDVLVKTDKITGRYHNDYYDFTNLVSGETYKFRVRAYYIGSGDAVYAGWSEFISAKIGVIPKSVSTEISGYSDIEVSWAKVDGVDSYEVECYNSSGVLVGSQKVQEDGTVSRPNCVFSELEAEETYKFRVRAYKGENSSDWSEFISKKMTVIPEESNAAVKTFTSISLGWKQVKGADGYEVECYDSSDVLVKTDKCDPCSYSLFNAYLFEELETGKTYKFRVRSYKDTTTSQWSEFVSLELSVTLGNLEITESDYFSVSLSWDSSVGYGGMTYEIDCYNADDDDSVKTVTTSNTTYTVKGLSPDTNYKFKIRCYDGSTYSDWSTFVSGSTKSPTSLTYTDMTDTSFTLIWPKSSTAAFKYYRLRYKDNVSNTEKSISCSNNYYTFTPTSLVSYDFILDYYVGDPNGYAVNISTLNVSPLKAYVCTPTPSLKVSNVSGSSISLSWTSSTNATMYYLHIYNSSGSLIYTISTPYTTYTMSDLAHNKTYYFEVWAYNGKNYSKASNKVSATTY